MNSFDNRAENELAAAGVPSDERYVIYRWLTSDDFMLQTLAPAATVIDASPDDTLDAIRPKIPSDASCFHFHINCTITSRFPLVRAELLEYLRSHRIRPVNAGLVDISKRAVQRCCSDLGLNTTIAQQEGDPEELIIVKTDLNFGGDSEWALSDEDRARLGVGAGSRLIYKPEHYQVLPRRQIDESWWTDTSLVFEKYIHNRANRWYRAVMLFSRLVLREMINPAQMKKVSDSIKTGEWNIKVEGSTLSSSNESYPSRMVHDLFLFARAFSMDFGAVDIVVNDAGDAHIIDVNSTPALTSSQPRLVEYLKGAFSEPATS